MERSVQPSHVPLPMVRNLNVAAARTGAALPQDLRLRRLVFGAPGIAQLLLADSRSDSFRVWRWICWTVQRSTQVPVVRRRFVTVWLIRWVVHLRPLQGMIRPDVSPRCQRRPPLVRRKLSPYRPAIHISDFSTATARRFCQCGAHRHIAGERKKGVPVVRNNFGAGSSTKGVSRWNRATGWPPLRGTMTSRCQSTRCRPTQECRPWSTRLSAYATLDVPTVSVSAVLNQRGESAPDA